MTLDLLTQPCGPLLVVIGLAGDAEPVVFVASVPHAVACAAMRDYAAVSYWLETCGDDLRPRPSLDGDMTVDVAILGGGYTGLWTAYYLLRAHPGIKVAIVEGEICGFGASGRNGAWCAPGLNITLGRLEQLHGHDAARRQYLAVSDAIDEVGRIATAEKIDIEW